MSEAEKEVWDVVVVGGGGAGLMCAATAGKRGRRVLLLEHQERFGKKILISGGGRCNFTNLHTTFANYLSEQPNFCRSALARYAPSEFIGLVEKHGIGYHEKKLGQLFCDKTSKDVVRLLESECLAGGVAMRTGTRIFDVGKHGTFWLKTSLGEFRTHALVIATGGLSFSNLGATGFGYEVAERFDLDLVERRPGLVPLTLDPGLLEELEPLSGVSFDSLASSGKGKFRENTLITHRGLSGPAILQVSSYWREGQEISLCLLPEKDVEAWVKRHRTSGKDVVQLLSDFLPARFAAKWCELHHLRGPVHGLSNQQIEKLIQSLSRWRLAPSGTEGYAKAEVTLGGVSTKELSSKTMESRKVPGLFFIGEVVDVTGHLGGFNFQWAWASGHAAGQAV